MSTGYLFKDSRDEERPFVLFVDNLETEEEDEATSLEARFTDFEEVAETTLMLFRKLGGFNIEFGEPDHYEEASGGND